MYIILLKSFFNFIKKHELFIHRIIFLLIISRLFFLEKNSKVFILELISTLIVLITSITSMVQEGKNFAKELNNSITPEDN